MAQNDRSETAAETATDPSNPPVVCTLTTKEASNQVLEWTELRRHVAQAMPIDGGARMTFPAAMEAGIRDLAEREQRCCAFLSIVTSVEGDHLTLDVTSQNPDALPVISQLAGIPLP